MDRVPSNESVAWFAVRARARREKQVAGFLGDQGYECFLPLYKCRRRWSDRIKELELPLFPGYLFCRFNAQRRLPVLMTPGVVDVVGVAKSPVPVSDAEIETVQTIIKSGLPSQPWPFVQVGQGVRIEYGALQGVEGVLLEFKGRHRLVVSITLLQRAVAVEIDRAWVTPVGRQPGLASTVFEFVPPVPVKVPV